MGLKRTEKEGMAMVERYRGSGQTQRAFASKEKIKLTTLSYWLRRSKEIEQKRDQVRFVQIEASQDQSEDCGVSVDLHFGKVTFKQLPPVGYLEKLLAIAGQR